LHRVIFCLTTERVTFTSSDSKFTSTFEANQLADPETTGRTEQDRSVARLLQV